MSKGRTVCKLLVSTVPPTWEAFYFLPLFPS